MARALKSGITQIYLNNNLPAPQIAVVTHSLECGPHVYLRFRNFDPKTCEEKPSLYADISGILTKEEVQKRDQSDVFQRANDAVNSGQIPSGVKDFERHFKIEKMFFDKLSKEFAKTKDQGIEK